MTHRRAPHSLDEHRFPVHPWRLTETSLDPDTLGHTESIFAVANGYIGMRANPEEGREAHSHGTFLNGVHETWRIRHAEEAFGFATTGQTIVNVPDAKLIKLYVDDEPLILANADLDHYERVLEFDKGVLTRDLVWRTPAGKRVHVRSTRMVSFEHRHLAVLTFEVTMLDEPAPVVISSQLINRQDGEDEYHVEDAALGEGIDPRRASRFDSRVLMPMVQRHDGDDVVLGYRCRSSGMTVAGSYRHLVECASEHQVETSVRPDLAKTVITVDAEPGVTTRIVKLVSYHSSTGVPAEELADRCQRTLARAAKTGPATLSREQASWLEQYWERTDVVVEGDPHLQQAVRWNLLQLAQATARTHEQGVAAKGVTAAGYEGHYFWDSEIYIIPFLAYTQPEAARKLLRFRHRLLDAARRRAEELNQAGALYPWRTINGEEASAYYAAGTAQYHINAAVAFAIRRYVDATADWEFLADEGAEILVETARMWADLGFYSNGGAFRIHGVTGPDEYTTVVNDNLYTNVMAQFNLRYAAEAVDYLADVRPDAYDALCRKVDLSASEVECWRAAADAMFIPYDEELGINPQDISFLDREPWDFAGTPPENYPLLLHYHPLVIYRYQVLKQADVVLAMFLAAEQFEPDQRRRNFEYYDPITTGDSSLSACVQAIVASDVGADDLAVEYFRQSVFVDLADTHGNAEDGVHIASAGGAWSIVAFGYAGMHDVGGVLRFHPRLPNQVEAISFRVTCRGALLRVDLDVEGCSINHLDGPPLEVGEAGNGVLERLGPGDVLVIPAHRNVGTS